MKRILPALCLLLVLPAQAEIYKWVDEKGRTHFGETLPEKYRKSGQALAPQPLNTIQGEALRRAAPPPGATDPAAAPPAPAASVAPVSAAQRCAEQHAKYRQSQECFARFRNANGSLKAEAAGQCQEVPQPACSEG